MRFIIFDYTAVLYEIFVYNSLTKDELLVSFSYISAEMVPYKNFDRNVDYNFIIPHIYPITNNSFPNIERGQFINGTFEPPSLDVYTLFSLKNSFYIFWGILFVQSLTIFAVDKVWVKNIPDTANFWNRILHSGMRSLPGTILLYGFYLFSPRNYTSFYL